MTEHDIPAEGEALRRTLPHVQSPVMGGNNLAITLASFFEPGIEDETLDEFDVWKQGAVDASNEVLNAIHAHYAAAITALSAERDEAKQWASEWHRICETVCTVLGVNADASEMAGAVRDKFDALQAERDALAERLRRVTLAVVDAVIAANPDKVEQVKARPSQLGWFFGQVIKQAGGGALAPQVEQLLRMRINPSETGHDL